MAKAKLKMRVLETVLRMVRSSHLRDELVQLAAEHPMLSSDSIKSKILFVVDKLAIEARIRTISVNLYRKLYTELFGTFNNGALQEALERYSNAGHNPVLNLNQNIQADQNPGLNQDIQADQNPGLNLNLNIQADQNPGLNQDIQADQNPGLNLNLNIQADQNPGLNQDIQADQNPGLNLNLNIQADQNPGLNLNLNVQADQNPGLNQDIQADQNPGLNLNLNVQADQNPGLNLNVQTGKVLKRLKRLSRKFKARKKQPRLGKGKDQNIRFQK